MRYFPRLGRGVWELRVLDALALLCERLVNFASLERACAGFFLPDEAAAGYRAQPQLDVCGRWGRLGVLFWVSEPYPYGASSGQDGQDIKLMCSQLRAESHNEGVGDVFSSPTPRSRF